MNSTPSKKFSHIIGIDEVGRGPLAGRICVGAVVLKTEINNQLKIVEGKDHKNYPCRLSDSKKLSEKQRKDWFLWVKENEIIYSRSSVSHKVIDKINISNACNRAAHRSLDKILKSIPKNKKNKFLVIADGIIKVNSSRFENIFFKSFPKADEIVPAVSLASIVAKVHRDREMVRLDKKYPKYGFSEHKGYGTKKHIKAIKKYGPSEIHRRSFIKNFVKKGV